MRYEGVCPPTVLAAGEGSEERMIGLERWGRLGGGFFDSLPCSLGNPKLLYPQSGYVRMRFRWC